MARKSKSQPGRMFPQAVPAMPDGYYSGDKPNPNLRAFVEAHIREHPYDPETDHYDVPAFDKPIETTKATAIYNMHTYWSKKPHDAIRQYIRHYTQPGDLVLDPFCGSGGTALAALMEGRKAIAIDRSPAATFITKNYCTPVNVEELQKAFDELKKKVQPEIDWLYETRCDRCGGPAMTNYTVYSQVFECPRCLEKVPLFDCVGAEGKTGQGKIKKLSVCPYCHARGFEEEISTRGKKFGAVPVLVGYSCNGNCQPRFEERRHNDKDPNKCNYFKKHDLVKIQEIEEKEIPHWTPPHKMMNVEDDSLPWGDNWRLGRNFRKITDLYTKRNTWALAAILSAIKSNKAQDQLLFGFEGILVNLSRMQGYSTDPRFPNNLFKGTYYIPQIGKEYFVLDWYSGKITNLVKGYEKINQTMNVPPKVLVSTQSAFEPLSAPANTMDYIFTDPPYSGTIQYGELNFVWEAWLDLDTHWHDDEVIVNEMRGKTEADWAGMMRKAMAECYRVLKPGRAISVCYHDTSEGTWALLQDIMAESGFVAEHIEKATYIDAKQKSYNQLTADKVTKRDLVITFRKPRPGEAVASMFITGQEDDATFGDKVRRIIHDYLDANPGSAKDRIYDEVVSRMVRSGQMEAHDFDSILRTVAEEVKTPVSNGRSRNGGNYSADSQDIGRWYLKETELAVADAAESGREDAAAVRLTTYITTWLHDHPAVEGVHYSDLFEQYIYGVKDKPRRPLADFLPDFFYRTDDGGWRLPASEEEQQAKAKARTQGVGRRVRRYISMLKNGLPIPTAERPANATLAEWLRHCKRAGWYAEGKYLYERGGLDASGLSEDAQADIEEDYQTCARKIMAGA